MFACNGRIAGELAACNKRHGGLRLPGKLGPCFGLDASRRAGGIDQKTHEDAVAAAGIAVKPIKAGEFVTMDYAQTEARLFKDFECSCGAPNCRGHVTGYMEREEDKAAAARLAG